MHCYDMHCKMWTILVESKIWLVTFVMNASLATHNYSLIVWGKNTKTILDDVSEGENCYIYPFSQGITLKLNLSI